jgi:hypothetical protein
VSVKTQQRDIRNNTLLRISTLPESSSTYCMDLTLEGLTMTQVESKHLALLL